MILAPAEPLDGIPRPCAIPGQGISWLLARPEIPSVIAGVTSTDQVAANASAANWHLTDSDMATIAAISTPADHLDSTGPSKNV